MAQRRARWLIVPAVLLLVGIAAWALLRNEEAEETVALPAPPQFSDFVGVARCAECHAGIAESFSLTGHAHTIEASADSELARSLAGKVVPDPERNRAFHYHFSEEEGLTVTIPGMFGGDAFPLTWLLGSNQHARTFLTLIPNYDGRTAGLEHRISFFGEDLALTPSHAEKVPQERVEAFGRLQEPETTDRCVGCHTTHFEIRNHALEKVIPNVQCEACHGPGRQHVANMEAGLSDFAIRSLRAPEAATARQQIERCGHCHRLPSDFLPEDITPDYRQLARFQPVGILESKCFEGSGGKLSCTTCHDPHVSVQFREGPSIGSCLKCHSDAHPGQVICPISPRTDCIRCHMPPVELHPGISFHDHWIRVRNESPDN